MAPAGFDLPAPGRAGRSFRLEQPAMDKTVVFFLAVFQLPGPSLRFLQLGAAVPQLRFLGLHRQTLGALVLPALGLPDLSAFLPDGKAGF